MEIASNLAESQQISLGKAISILARKGAQAEAPIQYKNGFPVAATPADTPTFGLDEIDRALDRGDAEAGAAFLKPAKSGK